MERFQRDRSTGVDDATATRIRFDVGRIGCFLNGCCYGHACDMPWAMVFPVEGGHAGDRTPPSHPTQLYSAALALLLLGVMQRAKLSEKFNQFPGQLTLLFFALYAVERFFIEFFRAGATARYLFGSPLTEAQFVSRRFNTWGFAHECCALFMPSLDWRYERNAFADDLGELDRLVHGTPLHRTLGDMILDDFFVSEVGLTVYAVG